MHAVRPARQANCARHAGAATRPAESQPPKEELEGDDDLHQKLMSLQAMRAWGQNECRNLEKVLEDSRVRHVPPRFEVA